MKISRHQFRPLNRRISMQIPLKRDRFDSLIAGRHLKGDTVGLFVLTDRFSFFSLFRYRRFFPSLFPFSGMCVRRPRLT